MLTDLLSDQVQVAFDNLQPSIPHIRAGSAAPVIQPTVFSRRGGGPAVERMTGRSAALENPASIRWRPHNRSVTIRMPSQRERPAPALHQDGAAGDHDEMRVSAATPPLFPPSQAGGAGRVCRGGGERGCSGGAAHGARELLARDERFLGRSVRRNGQTLYPIGEIAQYGGEAGCGHAAASSV
jgi:hypothetical protein